MIGKGKGIKLEGNWDEGWALDWHREDGYKITIIGKLFHTLIGAYLYQLKYCEPSTKTNNLIYNLAQETVNFLKTRHFYQYLEAIIPVPPSQERKLQPVIEIAKEIGRRTGIRVDTEYLIKVKKTLPLKSINDIESRMEQLKGAFKVVDQRYKGKSVTRSRK
ncbi:MAG: hypothetical protein ABIL89_01445 [candidate division WOR-3 bacterium]